MTNGVKRSRIIIIAAIIVLILFMVSIVIVKVGGREAEQTKTAFAFNPDPTYYTEKFRPQYHLSPEKGNMSDPNGMVYFEGEYHQFYQHSGQWGHAISKDLVHWEHLPLAIAKDSLGDIWSGSAVVDWKDTTGFFGGKAGLVAIFTHFKDGVQSQSLAYSTDKGRNWTKYEGNPVIPNPGLKDFRDPKVIWYEPSHSWVMVVSVDNRVRFYTSADLKKWEMTGEFGLGHGSHAAVWECPDLFELPVEGMKEKKWVLTVSIGNNTQTKGSTAQYFVGSFDGKTFKDDNKPYSKLWTDYGRDFYAAVSYSDIPAEDGRRIWLGWMSNWRYPFSLPTGIWKGNMSIPRELTLRDIPGEGIRLIQEPVRELDTLRDKAVKISEQKLEPGGSNPLKDVKGTSFELETEFTATSAVESFGIKVREGGKQETVIRYETKTAQLVVDRMNAGESSFENQFAEAVSAPLKLRDNKLKLRIFVDDTTLEVFANDGEVVLTSLIFPDATSNGLELFTKGGSVKLDKAIFYPLQSVWRDENPDGKQPLRIVVNKNILQMKEGQTLELAASILPLGAKQLVKWASSDESVVMVKSAAGTTAIATGMKEGKAEIKASSDDGSVTYSLNVFVAAR
ncbi:hypothetical protein Back11_55420 [Paenibacillus baekrokdamisoli]|uniref:Uncharacterized protein n=1 Tax=Paenibacillus baekrokdamisoli TaxID=1712516 RepID=A0A3G9IZ35_9BACL|nr:glycoside hydrolase family 32 protein [Paenibacillus baekrokdamisoli]MBB3071821.1 fructan beta-fructosidase [Paenibacillus baekrokdamisoli]BBH24197.1 hypothetical protein Back11_55420 [Paenibacillus baekrokdamisoli]